ncbi:MAG: glutamate--tRNA ligase family protein [Chloroflexota bacterium]|nr:glutamate--tRNA ligase family protein [Chloroflexota bacterium]
MVRVRFAPSPTGSLHVGGALTAVANRRFADERGGVMTLRIDDTDASRSAPDAEAEIVRDLEWLGVRWDEGPVRQSERGDLYRGAAETLVEVGAAYDDAGALRLAADSRTTLLRPDGSATYHLASVVDDKELGITHVIRGKDHLANAPVHAALARALGTEPPEYLHHGLLVGPDRAKLSKRHGAASLADLREAGIPPEAVRRYLEELGLPRGDVRFDETRLRRLAVAAIAELPDDELAARAGAPVEFAPALRGARTLAEAREIAASLLASPSPGPMPPGARETLSRFRALREGANGELESGQAQAIVRELRAAGGDLRALRLVLTGAERGPELWTVILALPRDEALRRIDAAL